MRSGLGRKETLLTPCVGVKLASFCFTKSLLCNDAFIQGICFIQSLHFYYVLQEDSVKILRQLKLVPLQPSGRLTVQASSVRTTRTFRLNLPLCQEASNCSSLHPSTSFSNTSGRHSVFDQLWFFFSKHRYGKTATTVRTMWIPVRTCSFISQVMHSKSRRPDVGLHGPNTRASYMEIA
jgi:hypothetical protein